MRWNEVHECWVGTDMEGNDSVLLKFTQYESEESEKELRERLINGS
jgi:hypothetical protein